MKTITIAAALVGIAVAGFAAAGLTPQERIAQLEAENALLRKTIEAKNQQIETLKKGVLPTELKPRPQPEAEPETKPAESPKPKYPYVSEALNKPCGKTEFEWRCLENSIFHKPQPVLLNREFELLHIEAQPSSEMLLVRANVTRRKGVTEGPGHKQWGRILNIGTIAVLRQVYRRFGEGDKLDSPFVHFRNLRMQFYLDGVLAAERDWDGLHIKAAPI